MNYKIVETHGIGHFRRETVLATADTLSDAIATAHKLFAIVDLERDALNPHCADFYTACNRVMQIEPYHA